MEKGESASGIIAQAGIRRVLPFPAIFTTGISAPETLAYSGLQKNIPFVHPAAEGEKGWQR
jgi:hypothetical protein